jgi:hypothetical protein
MIYLLIAMYKLRGYNMFFWKTQGRRVFAGVKKIM